MDKNITLIGMPGAGKSTVGVILAKMLSFEFIDTDILIQTKYKMSLQDIVDRYGYMRLREIEEEITCSINPTRSVISTGGSVVYSEKSMNHLRNISIVVFLDVSFDNLLKRIKNFKTRGLAKSKDQTFYDLYVERNKLYKKYAQITVDCNDINQEQVAENIVKLAF